MQQSHPLPDSSWIYSWINKRIRRALWNIKRGRTKPSHPSSSHTAVLSGARRDSRHRQLRRWAAVTEAWRLAHEFYIILVGLKPMWSVQEVPGDACFKRGVKSGLLGESVTFHSTTVSTCFFLMSWEQERTASTDPILGWEKGKIPFQRIFRHFVFHTMNRQSGLNWSEHVFLWFCLFLHIVVAFVSFWQLLALQRRQRADGTEQEALKTVWFMNHKLNICMSLLNVSKTFLRLVLFMKARCKQPHYCVINTCLD